LDKNYYQNLDKDSLIQIIEQQQDEIADLKHEVNGLEIQNANLEIQ
jgi:hypothetical protein